MAPSGVTGGLDSGAPHRWLQLRYLMVTDVVRGEKAQLDSVTA